MQSAESGAESQAQSVVFLVEQARRTRAGRSVPCSASGSASEVVSKTQPSGRSTQAAETPLPAGASSIRWARSLGRVRRRAGRLRC